MNNFLITGYGRSGTKFLSKLMNMSKVWEVQHEPRGAYEEKLYNSGGKIDSKITEDFNKNFYGEVNSRMRFYFNDINVNKRGVIIRNPKDIITSVANRGKNDFEVNRIINELNYFWKIFNKWVLRDDVLLIEFERMVSDINYLNDILNYFDIKDVILNESVLNKKINQNNIIKYKTFEDLPIKFKNEFEKLDWNG